MYANISPRILNVLVGQMARACLCKHLIDDEVKSKLWIYRPSGNLFRIGCLTSFKSQSYFVPSGQQRLKIHPKLCFKGEKCEGFQLWRWGTFWRWTHLALMPVHTVAPGRELLCFRELFVPEGLQEKLEWNFSQKHLLFWLFSPCFLGHHFHVSMILAKK